jgi:hypothetical protein
LCKKFYVSILRLFILFEFNRTGRKGSKRENSKIVYLLTSALPVPAPAPKTPGDNGGVQPKTPPTSKPGFQPLSETTKGAFVGGATAICGAAFFYLGFACAVLLVIGGILVNRPPLNIGPY